MFRRRHSAQAHDFQSLSAGKQAPLIYEFWDFLKHSKKWWLLPIIIVILLLGLLVVLGSTGLAPFIYPLF